jgi:putative methionine-R-sulfoxide reductase with GAF domain
MAQLIPFELIGGPCDGEILCLEGPRLEIVMPICDDPMKITEIDPDSHCLVKYHVAVYRKVVDKNQYQFTGTRLH